MPWSHLSSLCIILLWPQWAEGGQLHRLPKISFAPGSTQAAQCLLCINWSRVW